MIVPQRNMMGNAKRKPLTKRKVTKVNNVIWETLKQCAIALEDEDDDSNNNKFYTLPTSPLKSIYEETKSRMQVDYGVWNSKILLATHENIMHKVLNVKILSLLSTFIYV